MRVNGDKARRTRDQLEEKRSQLSRDLARHQHAEGAYMELGSKLIELIAQAPQIFERADPEQRRELVGLLTSNRVLKGRTLEFELRKPFDTLVSAANSENGWVNWSGLATPLSGMTDALADSVSALGVLL